MFVLLCSSSGSYRVMRSDLDFHRIHSFLFFSCLLEKSSSFSIFVALDFLNSARSAPERVFGQSLEFAFTYLSKHWHF